MSAAESKVVVPPLPPKNEPLFGEMNATTSFLISAIAISLFAIACASCSG